MRDHEEAESQLSSNSPEKASLFRTGLPQILAVCVKNVLLLGYGMTLGFPTIVIPAIQGGDGREASTHGELILNKDEISWFSSINLICVPLGCIFSGAFTQPIGRRRAMQFVNIPIFVAWLLFYFSTNIYYLYGGLCLAGISGGLMEAPVLTYVAEVTQPRFRGMLSATGSTCVIFGVFSQFIMGTFLPWRTVALCSTVLPIISTCLLFFVPESPHWLIRKQRYDEAKQSLAWLRGWVPIDNIATEYEAIKDHISKHHNQPNKTFKTQAQRYFTSSFLYPYFLVSLTFFIGHFSGMTTLQTYAVQIFHTLKAPIDKYYATSLLGTAELTGTIICVILVHYTGKRPLVFLSTVGCGICFFSTAMYAFFLDSVPGVAVNNIIVNASAINSHSYFHIIPLNKTQIAYEAHMMTTTYLPELDNETSTDNTTFGDIHFDNLQFSEFSANESSEINYFDQDKSSTTTTEESPGPPENIILPIPEVYENKYLWLPLTLLLLSALLSHAGIRLIPWMLIGEVFPSSVRSVASGLSGGTGYVFGFLANKLFLKMIGTLSLPGTFFLYSSISILGAIVLYFILPETEGHTLHEIESHFTGGKRLPKRIGRTPKLPPPRHDRIQNPQTAPQIIVTSNDELEQQKFNVKNWESSTKFEKHLDQMRENGIKTPLGQHRLNKKMKNGQSVKATGHNNPAFLNERNEHTTHL